MSELFKAIPGLRSYMDNIAAGRARDPDFDRRYYAGEIDIEGNIVPRNPKVVATIKEQILATREPALLGFESENQTKSKICGEPNLPVAVAWPCHKARPLAFIAQIDLAELPRHEAFSWLPAKGMLFFFAGYDFHETIDEEEWRDEGEWSEEVYRVFYSTEATAPLRTAPSGAPLTGEEQNLQFDLIDTYSILLAEHDACQSDDNNELWTWRCKLDDKLSNRVNWQFGGWPRVLQNQERVRGQSDAKLIGQFDIYDIAKFSGGYMRGFFMIRELDAKNLDFDKALLIGEAD